MRVYVKHWMGGKMPYEEGEHDLSEKDILALFDLGYDVMLHHKDKKLENHVPILYLDDFGRTFRQR